MEGSKIYKHSTMIRNIALDEGQPTKDLVIKQMACNIIQNMPLDDLLKLFTLKEFSEDNFSRPHEDSSTHFELIINV
jgi:hypothetical protein